MNFVAGSVAFFVTLATILFLYKTRAISKDYLHSSIIHVIIVPTLYAVTNFALILTYILVYYKLRRVNEVMSCIIMPFIAVFLWSIMVYVFKDIEEKERNTSFLISVVMVILMNVFIGVENVVFGYVAGIIIALFLGNYFSIPDIFKSDFKFNLCSYFKGVICKFSFCSRKVIIMFVSSIILLLVIIIGWKHDEIHIIINSVSIGMTGAVLVSVIDLIIIVIVRKNRKKVLDRD